MSEIGVIQEQGDLGLGWEPVNEQDQAKLEKENKQDKDNKGAH